MYIDLDGPLSSSTGNRCVLTMVDRFTFRPEACPPADTRTTTVAKALIQVRILRFAVPDTITADQGRQIESLSPMRLNKLLGCNQVSTAAYDPGANGTDERFHQHLKDFLHCRFAETDCTEYVSPALLWFRATQKEVLMASPAELIFSQNIFFLLFLENVSSKSATHVSETAHVL